MHLAVEPCVVSGQIYDVLVVGGGINGTGIARDAAGRGLSVLLCERDDLAQHTSSASTKLIHGGLRYLEFYEFGLVRKALQEREVLLRAAPHIIWPLRFVMPHDKAQRPQWMIRAGLFLYDHLARRRILPGTESIRFAKHVSGEPLRAGFSRGFVYSDGWVQDARLVVLNALDAVLRGATVLTRTACVAARRTDQVWCCTLRDERGHEQEVMARALVNAAGPWVESVLSDTLGERAARSVRLVKGSHIIVRKLFNHPYAYIFQNPDKRIIFAIPYENDFTLIGTTDIEYQGDPAQVAIDQDEINYLCSMSNRYFTQQISAQDVVSTYSGVRPLLDDATENAASVTRDYALAFDLNGPALLSVFGGKITTYRKLAEQALEQLTAHLGNTAANWTEHAVLPGGDMEQASFDRFWSAVELRYSWLPKALAWRYARAYGTRMHILLENKQCMADLGVEIVAGLFVAEVRYLQRYEWACRADDILWRRSKLRLHTAADATAVLDQWLEKNPL